MVTCPAIFSSSTSEPRPCRSSRPFISTARIRSLRPTSRRTLPPTLDSRTSPRLLASLDVAVHVGHFVIARGAARFHRQAARHRHIQIVGDALVVGRVILVGANQQAVALRDDFDRGFRVGAVGVLALVGADQICAR